MSTEVSSKARIAARHGSPDRVRRSFFLAFVAFLAVSAVLNVLSTRHIPCAAGGASAGRSIEFLHAPDRGRILAEEARTARVFMRGCQGGVAPTTDTGADTKRIQKFWLWIDNAFVLVYTAMFVFGFVLAHRALARRTNGTVAKVFLYVVLSTSIAGAIADYSENFRLLAGLAAAAKVDALAQQIAPWTIAKFVLFLANALLLVPAATLALRRRSQMGR